MNVMIIDDDTWQADLYKTELEQSGHHVAMAHDAYQAIDMIDNAPPDVIVLDMLLPGSNGVALLHELRSYNDLGDIPVVVVSAQAVAPKTLRPYGVMRTLDKTTLKRGDIVAAVEAVGA